MSMIISINSIELELERITSPRTNSLQSIESKISFFQIIGKRNLDQCEYILRSYRCDYRSTWSWIILEESRWCWYVRYSYKSKTISCLSTNGKIDDLVDLLLFFVLFVQSIYGPTLIVHPSKAIHTTWWQFEN